MRRPLLAVLVVGCALRLTMLGSRSLWTDEANTLFIAQSPLSLVVPRVAALEENPPLHYLLMHFWTFWFADPVSGLRFFSALCGIASLLLFLALCRRLIPAEAETAVVLAALSSFWIHFSQDGRIYGLLLLLSLAATLALLRLDERWSARGAVHYGLLCLAGLYTHNFFFFVLLGHATHLALRRKLERRHATVYAVLFLLYLPWLAAAAYQIKLLARASVLEEPLTMRNLCYVLGTMLCDTSFLSFAHESATTALGACVLGFLALSFALARGKLGDGAAFCALQLAAGLLGLRAVELLIHRSATQARYLIFLSPFLYMLLAVVFERASAGPARFLRVPAAVVMSAATLFYFIGGIYVDPHLEALTALLRRADPRAPIVHLDPFYYLPMRYYYLPERAHHMAGPDYKVMNWEKLPGYRAYLTPAELRAQKLCVVVDPRRVLSPKRVTLAACSDVARAAYPEGKTGGP